MTDWSWVSVLFIYEIKNEQLIYTKHKKTNKTMKSFEEF